MPSFVCHFIFINLNVLLPECPEGKYGVDCMLSCKNCENVIGQNDTCDHVTGKCILGCLPGWRGLKCEQSKITELQHTYIWGLRFG